MTDVEKPRITKIIVAINLFLFINNFYYNKTMTDSSTLFSNINLFNKVILTLLIK